MRALLTQNSNQHEHQTDRDDYAGDDPALEACLLATASGEEGGLASLVAAEPGHIVEVAVDDA